MMLSIGQLAPDFTGKTDTNEFIKLSDFKEKIVILFFYPAAHTPGCTAQACGFRDIFDDLVELNVQVIGISIDKNEKQSSFRAKHHLQFPLISDNSKEISKLYGGIGKLGKANRVTFLINKGHIRKIWKLTGIFAQLNLQTHAEKVKNSIIELQQENHV